MLEIIGDSLINNQDLEVHLHNNLITDDGAKYIQDNLLSHNNTIKIKIYEGKDDRDFNSNNVSEIYLDDDGYIIPLPCKRKL